MHHAADTTGTTAAPTPAREPRFEDLYEAHFAELTVRLFAYFGDRQEAQDVVQEAFCRALSRWPALTRYDDPVAWVRRVAWNLADLPVGEIADREGVAPGTVKSWLHRGRTALVAQLGQPDSGGVS